VPLYVPAAHRVHSAAFAAEYEPTAQLVQLVKPSALAKAPAAQLTHGTVVDGEYLPTLQLRQLADPDWSANWPGTQATQLADLEAPCTKPTAQLVHPLAPAAE